MTTIVLTVALRIIVIFALYCFALSILSRLSNIDLAVKVKRKVYARWVLGMTLLLLSFIYMDAYTFLIATKSLQASEGHINLFGYISVWTVGTWVIVSIPFFISVGLFYFRHLPACKELDKMISRLETDLLDTIGTNTIDHIHRKISELEAVFPLGLAFLCSRLRVRLLNLDLDGQDILTVVAANHMKSGNYHESLGALTKCAGFVTESMLIAMECQNWLETERLLSKCTSRELVSEAAQMMAEFSSSSESREQGKRWLDGEDGRRRYAAIENRKGNRQKAQELVSNDWEARGWFTEHDSTR